MTKTTTTKRFTASVLVIAILLSLFSGAFAAEPEDLDPPAEIAEHADDNYTYADCTDTPESTKLICEIPEHTHGDGTCDVCTLESHDHPEACYTTETVCGHICSEETGCITLIPGCPEDCADAHHDDCEADCETDHGHIADSSDTVCIYHTDCVGIEGDCAAESKTTTCVSLHHDDCNDECTIEAHTHIAYGEENSCFEPVPASHVCGTRTRKTGGLAVTLPVFSAPASNDFQSTAGHKLDWDDDGKGSYNSTDARAVNGIDISIIVEDADGKTYSFKPTNPTAPLTAANKTSNFANVATGNATVTVYVADRYITSSRWIADLYMAEMTIEIKEGENSLQIPKNEIKFVKKDGSDAYFDHIDIEIAKVSFDYTLNGKNVKVSIDTSDLYNSIRLYEVTSTGVVLPVSFIGYERHEGNKLEFDITKNFNKQSTFYIEIDYDIEGYGEVTFRSPMYDYWGKLQANTCKGTDNVNKGLDMLISVDAIKDLIDQGSLIITKKIPNASGKGVNGDKFTFSISGPNGFTATETITVNSNGTGTVSLLNIPVGVYTITESYEGNKNYKTEGSKTVSVTKGEGAAATVEFNNYIDRAAISVSKIVTGLPVGKSFEFKITGPGNYSKTFTLANGQSYNAIVNTAGTYKITETSSNVNVDGYNKGETTIAGASTISEYVAEVKVSGTEQHNVTFTNPYEAKTEEYYIKHEYYLNNLTGTPEGTFGPETKTVTFPNTAPTDANKDQVASDNLRETDNSKTYEYKTVAYNPDTKTFTLKYLRTSSAAIEVAKAITGISTDRVFAFTVTNADGEAAGSFEIAGGRSSSVSITIPGTYTITEDDDTVEITGYDKKTTTILGAAEKTGYVATVEITLEDINAGTTKTVTFTNPYEAQKQEYTVVHEYYVDGETAPEGTHTEDTVTVTFPDGIPTTEYIEEHNKRLTDEGKTYGYVSIEFEDSTNTFTLEYRRYTYEIIHEYYVDDEEIPEHTSDPDEREGTEIPSEKDIEDNETIPEYDDNDYEVEKVEYNEDEHTFTITYRRRTTEVTITKIWDDANDQDGKRPNDLTVTLLADGGNGKEYNGAWNKVDNTWTLTIKGLTKNNYENGKFVNEIIYSVVEIIDEDTNSSLLGVYDIAPQDGDSLTITNVHAPEMTNLLVRKTWDENAPQSTIPQSIEVQLFADGRPVLDADDNTVTIILTDDGYGNWQGSFDNLPMYENGSVINYTARELTNNSSFRPSYTDPSMETDGMQFIHNTYIPPQIDGTPDFYNIIINYINEATGEKMTVSYTDCLEEGTRYDIQTPFDQEFASFVRTRVDNQKNWTLTGNIHEDIEITIYYNQPTIITDTEPPLTDVDGATDPEPEAPVEIPEPTTPLAPAPQPISTVTIDETPVPLADAPKTADTVNPIVLWSLLISSLLAMAAVIIIEKKKNTCK